MNLWIAVAVVVLAGWAWSRLRPNPVALVPAAVASGDLSPLRAALARSAGPTDYDQVLKRLWNGYHRAEAAELAKDFASRHRGAAVSQYWLRKVMEDEPGIAAKAFDDAFLAQWYDPQVAASCGKCGSCSCG